MLGQMATNANYPSDAGIPVDHSQQLGGFSDTPYLGVMSISGTPGTTSAYYAEALIEDGDGSQWATIAGTYKSGDGAAATGQVVFQFTGQAIRLNATNGTSPGTGADTPSYVLEVFPLHEGLAAGVLQ